MSPFKKEISSSNHQIWEDMFKLAWKMHQLFGSQTGPRGHKTSPRRKIPRKKPKMQQPKMRQFQNTIAKKQKSPQKTPDQHHQKPTPKKTTTPPPKKKLTKNPPVSIWSKLPTSSTTDRPGVACNNSSKTTASVRALLAPCPKVPPVECAASPSNKLRDTLVLGAKKNCESWMGRVNKRIPGN